MKKIYTDFKEGRPIKGLVRFSAILILIMVWILIDKGNIYGQSSADSGLRTSKQIASDQSFMKIGGGERDGKDGIDDPDDDNSFTVYPNPAQKDLVFDFEFTVKEEGPYEVLDALGRMVDRGMIHPGMNHYSINVEKFEPGLYLIRVKLDGKLQVKRIIKK